MAFLGGQFKSATHGQFKSAQGGQFDRLLHATAALQFWTSESAAARMRLTLYKK